MAFSYPLAAEFFFDLLPVQNARFRLIQPQETNNLAKGEVLSADVGDAYWEGDVSLAPISGRDADQILSLLEALRVPGRPFEAYHPFRIGPRYDPLGTALASEAPVLEDVNTGNYANFKLGGLPDGFDICAGDLFSIDYGGRRHLHRVFDGRQARTTSAFSGYTQLSVMTMVPPLLPGFTEGQSITLVRPSIWAVLVPGSVNEGDQNGHKTSGISFQFRQTLRAYS